LVYILEFPWYKRKVRKTKNKQKGENVMNKTGLVDFVSAETGLTKKDARVAVEAFIGGVERGLVEDGEVKLVGFGSFKTKVRAAREGRNPQNGEAINIPEKRVPSFKASETLKDAVS
jgi:DNA-binding protein HU-beta